MTPTLLYLADRRGEQFQQARMSVDVVCAGDSITGWNNYGRVRSWGYRSYPKFLQESCVPLGLSVANCGIAGEISDNGVFQVREYLTLFPHARYFVIGFGTNDLGSGPDFRGTSSRILANLEQMVQAVVQQAKKPVLFNVPYGNPFRMSAAAAQEANAKRDYHNPRLSQFCERLGLPLADVCSRLLADEHFADELHPSDVGARIIAEEVFKVLGRVVKRENEGGVREGRVGKGENGKD